MEYYSAIKKNIFESVLMRWINWSLSYRVKKARKKNTNIVYSRIHMEFRKIVMITLYARQQKRHRCVEQTWALRERERERERERVG